MDATFKHSIQARAIYVLCKEREDLNENIEAQKIYLEKNIEIATTKLNAVNDSRWEKTNGKSDRQSYDLPKRFTRDNA